MCKELKDESIFQLNKTKIIKILNTMVEYQDNLDKEEIVDILKTMAKDLQKSKEEF